MAKEIVLSVINNRVGLNKRQIDAFAKLLAGLKFDIGIHGGDKQDNLVHSMLLDTDKKIEVYPLEKHVSFPINQRVIEHEPLGLLDRNKTLVERADIIVGIPKYMAEDEDSPFWKTMRNAINQDRDIYCISSFGYVWSFWD